MRPFHKLPDQPSSSFPAYVHKPPAAGLLAVSLTDRPTARRAYKRNHHSIAICAHTWSYEIWRRGWI